MVGGGQGAFIGAVHRIAARLDDRYELVAGALSSDPARAKASAAELRIAPERAYGSFAEMVEHEAARDDGVDAVAIVTPNHVHHPAAKAFLEAGIHVICDKPLTTNLPDALDLVETVRRTGLVFGLTHNYTGFPMVREARERAAGELGRIRVVQAEYPQDWLSTPLEETGQKQAAWRTDPAQSAAAPSATSAAMPSTSRRSFPASRRKPCAPTSRPSSTAAESTTTATSCCATGRRARHAVGLAGGAGQRQRAPVRVYGDQGGLAWHQEYPTSSTCARSASRRRGSSAPSRRRARAPAG